MVFSFFSSSPLLKKITQQTPLVNWITTRSLTSHHRLLNKRIRNIYIVLRVRHFESVLETLYESLFWSKKSALKKYISSRMIFCDASLVGTLRSWFWLSEEVEININFLDEPLTCSGSCTKSWLGSVTIIQNHSNFQLMFAFQDEKKLALCYDGSHVNFLPHCIM